MEAPKSELIRKIKHSRPNELRKLARAAMFGRLMKVIERDGTIHWIGSSNVVKSATQKDRDQAFEIDARKPWWLSNESTCHIET